MTAPATAIGRRQAAATLAGATLAGAAGLGALWSAAPGIGAARAAGPSSLTFEEIPRRIDATHHVPPGYRAEVLIGWGDAVEDGAPAFDVDRQSAAAQRRQFGYNNDYVSYLPLPRGSAGSDHGLLCVNHEFTIPRLMFADAPGRRRLARDQAEIEMAAHGHSVVEIRKTQGAWQVVRPSRYGRRITALDTPVRLSGPAAGHPRLRTRADPSGRLVVGMLANCAGGTTPWGTVLTAEEGFRTYFAGEPELGPEARNHRRYRVGGRGGYAWWRHHPRFDLDLEPNEPNRFGWIAELDPYDPRSMPVKRTALGRFAHEAATVALSRDGRAVVYSGDDANFEYIYRFVSRGRYDQGDRAANLNLLDDGVLSVARFAADGTVAWLPLVFGRAPLTPANGFHGQADVAIETRRAADLLGATPMDRPEDIEPNPVTGSVFVMLTGNRRRDRRRTDAANPRGPNPHGHILELIPPDADHAGAVFRWRIAVLCGNPRDADDGARYHPAIGADGWLSAPDNCAFDSRGRLWIASDAGAADGIWAMDTTGPGRALTRHFLSAPRGAEPTGPCFTPDDRTLFVAIQHPGKEKGSSWASPSTRWPDFRRHLPPRPAVLAITRRDGGIVGE